MTQTTSTSVHPVPADSAAEMIKLARQATARIVTAALEATAEAADMERALRARKSPALVSLPAGLQIDPQQIRDFTRSRPYCDLIEQYILGGLGQPGHLLTHALALLQQHLPLLFAR